MIYLFWWCCVICLHLVYDLILLVIHLAKEISSEGTKTKLSERVLVGEIPHEMYVTILKVQQLSGLFILSAIMLLQKSWAGWNLLFLFKHSGKKYAIVHKSDYQDHPPTPTCLHLRGTEFALHMTSTRIIIEGTKYTVFQKFGTSN